MFLRLFGIAFVIGCISAAPQEQPAAAPAPASGANPNGGTPVPIVAQTEENNPDGSFQFSYETGNGIKVEEKGYLKDGANSSEKIQVIEGSVSYTDNEGNPVNLKYIADENGFQPQGDHIPQPPGGAAGAPPAAPAATVDQSAQQQQGSNPVAPVGENAETQ